MYCQHKKMFADDWGTDIVIDTKASDLTEVTSITFYIKQPDLVILTRTGYRWGSSVSQVYYRTVDGDITQVGDHEIWATIVWNDGERQLTTDPFIENVKVNPNAS